MEPNPYESPASVPVAATKANPVSLNSSSYRYAPWIVLDCCCPCDDASWARSIFDASVSFMRNWLRTPGIRLEAKVSAWTLFAASLAPLIVVANHLDELIATAGLSSGQLLFACSLLPATISAMLIVFAHSSLTH